MAVNAYSFVAVQFMCQPQLFLAVSAVIPELALIQRKNPVVVTL